MKKKWFLRIAYLLLFVQLIGCRKSLQNDQSSQNADALQSAAILRAPIPACRIEMITSWSAVDTPLIGKFSYNDKGNPVRVEFNLVSTGRPNLIFYYDKKHRLTDYIGPYQIDPNSTYEFWYHYQYDQTGERVLVDTQYVFGTMVNGVPQPNALYKYAGNYEYDVQGRISRVTRVLMLPTGPLFPAYVDTYEYDTEGNLIGFGPYDNRINLHRTNKVWQFVDRNYSVNNPAWAEKYNSLGYPLRFNTSTPLWFSFVNQLDLHNSEIVYQCHE
jgi:hypothetical protein